MPHRFERILSASTRNELGDALSFVERENYTTSLFLGARCYRGEVGPPQTKGRGQRWFDEVQNPDQLWLPFKWYKPVKILGAYTNYHSEYGDGWIITYRNYRGRDRELAYHVNQTEGGNRIVALSLYRRREVLETPPAPFPEWSIPLRRRQPTPDNSASVPPISQELSDILAEVYIRTHLECAVSALEDVRQSVLLNSETGIFYKHENGEAIGHVSRHLLVGTAGPFDPTRTDFQIVIYTHLENNYAVTVRIPTEIWRDFNGVNE